MPWYYVTVSGSDRHTHTQRLHCVLTHMCSEMPIINIASCNCSKTVDILDVRDTGIPGLTTADNTLH